MTMTADVTDAQSGVNYVYRQCQPADNHPPGLRIPDQGGGYGHDVPRHHDCAPLAGQRDLARQLGAARGQDRKRPGYNYDQLGTAGFKRNLVVVSGADATLPSLVTFTRTPSSVDVRTADKTVNATMRVNDTGSGVSSVQLRFTSADGPSASMYPAPDLGHGQRRDVDRKFDRPEVLLQPRQLACVGVDCRFRRQLEDARLGRSGRVGAPVPAHRPGDRPCEPKATGPSSVTPTGNIVLQFNENVNGISAASATLRKSTFPNPGPALAGTWTCRTGADVATNCATGQVRKATFNPTATW